MASGFNNNDETSLHQSEPTRCSNGCGFFGTSATKGLCSKCYRDLVIAQAKSAVEKSFTPVDDLIRELEATSKSLPAAVPTPNNSASVVNVNEDFAWGAGDKKPVKNRCRHCKKKVGLLGFECRCGHTFCGTHRYAEAHGCDFDFKTKGRSEIAQANPVVKADKLEKLI